LLFILKFEETTLGTNTHTYTYTYTHTHMSTYICTHVNINAKCVYEL